MKSLPFALVLLAAVFPATGQDPMPEWTVTIPGPIAEGKASPPLPEPVPIDFTVRSSRTGRMEREEPPPMPGLPPVRGVVNVTVQMVEDPGLPDPPPPLPLLEPGDPAVLARMEETRQRIGEARDDYRGSDLAFVACEVVDHHRTLLRIYPNGRTGGMVTAVSNLDWNHFSGWAFWRTTYSDGSFHETGLIMGIGNAGHQRMREWSAETGSAEKTRDFSTELADARLAGPAFVVLEGSPDSPAMAILQQAHDLYQKEGARMEAAYRAREKAEAEQRAHFLSHPPKPRDVTIRFWKRNPPAAPQP